MKTLIVDFLRDVLFTGGNRGPIHCVLQYMPELYELSSAPPAVRRAHEENSAHMRRVNMKRRAPTTRNCEVTQSVGIAIYSDGETPLEVTTFQAVPCASSYAAQDANQHSYLIQMPYPLKYFPKTAGRISKLNMSFLKNRLEKGTGDLSQAGYTELFKEQQKESGRSGGRPPAPWKVGLEVTNQEHMRVVNDFRKERNVHTGTAYYFLKSVNAKLADLV